jgi:hypothetical protein
MRPLFDEMPLRRRGSGFECRFGVTALDGYRLRCDGFQISFLRHPRDRNRKVAPGAREQGCGRIGSSLRSNLTALSPVLRPGGTYAAPGLILASDGRGGVGLAPNFPIRLMRPGRTTGHENRVQRACPWRRVSLWYKQRWMAIAWRSGMSVWTSIPSVRLTRAGKGTTVCRTQKCEGRIAASVTDPRRSNRLR